MRIHRGRVYYMSWQARMEIWFDCFAGLPCSECLNKIAASSAGQGDVYTCLSELHPRQRRAAGAYKTIDILKFPSSVSREDESA